MGIGDRGAIKRKIEVINLITLSPFRLAHAIHFIELAWVNSPDIVFLKLPLRLWIFRSTLTLTLNDSKLNR